MENNSFVKYKDLLTIKEYDKEKNKEEFVFLPLEIVNPKITKEVKETIKKYIE